MKSAVLAMLAVSSLAQADTRLFTYGPDGRLLSESEAAIRAGGIAYVSRDALFGAAAASIRDERNAWHQVVWITADDAELGVAIVWIGLQAPPGPDASTKAPSTVTCAGHTAQVGGLREVGAEGMLARLEYASPRPAANAPLFDEHGLFAGWHTSRTVDGRVFHFAAPGGRLEMIPRTSRLTLDQWNARHDSGKESIYTRAIGHLYADDIDGALFYLREAVEAAPANARAWMQLGFAQGKAGQSRQRIESYRKAIELDPSLDAARYLLGMNLLMSGDRVGALVQHKALKDRKSHYATRLKLFLDSLHVDELKDNHVHHGHGKKA
ncbi:MAG: hypothetical protein C0504_06965 [Candidatus Solibacter sp.]|nr:hypothetical protein [Candidatus Solibacter sp.]